MAVLNATSSPASQDAVVVIDSGDLACGELLMLLHRQIRNLPAGTIVGILSGDPAAEIDLPAWCHLTGHRYQGRASPDGPIVIELAFHANPVDPDRPWRRLPTKESTP